MMVPANGAAGRRTESRPEGNAMLEFAICNELFEGWEWGRVCSFVAGLGYDAVEIAPFTFGPDVREITAPQRTQIVQTARAAGLSIVGLHWLLVSPPGLHVTSPGAETRRAAVDYLVALATLCADLGGRVMVLGSPKQRSLSPGVSRKDGEKWLVDALLQTAGVAYPRGVTLCMEPLPAEDTNLINTLEEAAAIVHAADNPGVRLILDVKSMGSEGTPIPDLIRKWGPLAAHFHANDTNRRGPGDGDTDFRPIFDALRDINYQGAVSVEVFDYTPDPETIARKSLGYMRLASRA
jgi:sugar phosphate isomerase/epimerase